MEKMPKNMEPMGGNLGGAFGDDVIKVEPMGGNLRGRFSGDQWDHGAYNGVRKVYVHVDDDFGLNYIRVDYENAGKVESRENGVVGRTAYEFELDYPDEYITSVKGTTKYNRITSLRFKTSKERISRTYGSTGHTSFVLESKGRALVGFHGLQHGRYIRAVGAYFGPPPPPVEKLQGKGGNRGASWDDGAFDGVRRIYVGLGQKGVASVKFVYDRNNNTVLGQDHGKKTLLGYEEFKLDFPNEYITAVEGCYDNIFGSESTVITMLKFKTNLRTSPDFGLYSTSSFILKKEGYKIVGFHGKSSHELHQIGVSVAPIYGSTKLRGNNMVNPKLSDSLEVTLHRIAGTTPELKICLGEEIFSEVLGKLEVSLLAGAKVLADADQKAYCVQEVKKWLTEFQDASFQAENIIEDMSEVSSEAPQSNAARMSNWNSKNELRKKMERIVALLENLVGQTNLLGLRDLGWLVKAPLTSRSRISPYLYETDFGRDVDKLAFTSLILSDDIASWGTLNVISVNGMPGIGKTTLVEVVYIDERITSHFDLRVWINVGQDFDVFKVTKEILHKITSVAVNTEDLASLQVQLNETLAGKRFLLVLDDFWSESSSQWELFLTALTGGPEGSKIVLTTQSDNVTTITEAARTYQLRLMTNTECWELICSSVFGYKSINSIDPELERVGKKIAEQCKGLPLSAVTIASHLRSKQNVKEWNDISNNFLHYTTDVLEVLRRSYDFLPAHLKGCFAFCSIFPKDYEFDRENLVLLWMAADLLYQPGTNQRLEDIGNKYLDDLVARSFIQSLDSKKRFTMHDHMNDLAKTVARDLCFRLEDDSLVDIPKRVRHLSVCGKQSVASTFTSEAEYLRTFLSLAVSPPRCVGPLPNFSDHALRCLRSLSLSHYHITKLPILFEGLKYLRYLDLSNTDLEEIPEFVCTLHSLQTLLLTNCFQLRRLAVKIVQLIQLRYLVLTGTPIVEMPRGIKRFQSLQRLSNFVIGKLSGAELQELRELSNLRRTLHISELQYVVSITEANDPGLKEKALLKKLVLTWSAESSNSNTISCDQREVLEMLQPHPNLEKVSINSYGGETFPSWLGHTSFISMTSVSLSSCSHCVSLPSLGQLPLLRFLSIEKFNILKKVGEEFFYSVKGNVSSIGPFPYLQNLSFYDMPIWEEWLCPELEGGIFPRLKKLTIRSCPSLKKLPKGLPDFTHVAVLDSGLRCEEDSSGKILELSSSKEEEMHGENLELHRQDPGNLAPNYENISVDSETTFSSDAAEDQDDIGFESCKVTEIHKLDKLSASLKRLHIEGFPKLVFLPETLFQDCPALEELLLIDCLSLQAFPGEYPSTTLKTMYIRDCMRLELTENLQTEPIFPELEDLFIGSSCSTLCLFPLFLFPNIKSLSIRDTENLSSFTVPYAHGDDVPLPLEALEIADCPNLEFFPKGGLGTLKLASLLISDCMNLKRLPTDLYTFTCLLSIRINNCPELDHIPNRGFPESLETLCISHCLKLIPKVEWGLFDLVNLCDLEIEGGNDESESSSSSFPDEKLLPRSLYSLRLSGFKNVQTLNYKGLEDLTTLGILEINGCNKLASLPDGGLSSSLSLLRINGCPRLKENITTKDMEWFKIKHIQLVEIDGEELIRGRYLSTNLSSSKEEELHRQELESSSQNYEDISVASKTTLSSDAGSAYGETMDDAIGFESCKVREVLEMENLSASLKKLHIEGFPKLEFLPKTLFQDCPALEELLLIDCLSLQAFPGGYPSTTLKTMYIRDCMRLELTENLQTEPIFPELEDLFIGSSCSTLCLFPLFLFPNLKSLSLRYTENLSSFTVAYAHGDDAPLPLEALEITDCPNLEYFPKGGLGTLKLASLLISDCMNLKKLPTDLYTFTCLLSIRINNCPELDHIPDRGFPESLETLCISRCQKLKPKVEWGLSYLDNLCDLEIETGNDDNESSSSSFPDEKLLPRSLYSLRLSGFKNVQTLNYKGLKDLTTLVILEISGCDKLASLPDEGLPSSLSLLRINGCPMLKENIYTKDMEWFKIKHIQLVEIDGEELIRGRKKTQFEKEALKAGEEKVH